MDEEEYEYVGNLLEEGSLSHSEIDTYFEHSGVKGMKWGTRKAKGATSYERRSNAGLAVDKARNYVRSGQAAKDRSKAKAQFDKDKYTKGRIEAHRILRENLRPVRAQIHNAQKVRNGKEAAG